MKKKISVVIPLLNEALGLKEVHREVTSVLNNLKVAYEIIFVDDGSTDRSFRVLEKLSNKENNIKVIQFTRTYGKSAALAAGFQEARGDIIITMDADLQDNPEEIPHLMARMEEGFDLVSGWRYKRKDNFFKKISSRVFNIVTSFLTGLKIHDFNCGLKAYKREVVKGIRLYGELHRFIPALVSWQGYRVGEVKVEHRPRKYGKTKFGTSRFFSGFFDLLTTLFITRYTTKPLHFFGATGLILFSLGFCINLVLLIWKYTVGLIISSGRPLLFLILGIFLIVVGLQFFAIGLLGEMIINSSQERKEYYLIKNRLP